eukprot:4167605-Pyramimonas_sp.AAC.1
MRLRAQRPARTGRGAPIPRGHAGAAPRLSRARPRRRRRCDAAQARPPASSDKAPAQQVHGAEEH